jgi:hypothetical protein
VLGVRENPATQGLVRSLPLKGEEKEKCIQESRSALKYDFLEEKLLP